MASRMTLNMLEDIPWHCPVMKDLIMDVSVGQVLEGSAISAFNPLAAQRYVLHADKEFSSFVCQEVVGAT